MVLGAAACGLIFSGPLHASDVSSLGPSVTVLANLEHRVLREKRREKALDLAELYVLFSRCDDISYILEKNVDLGLDTKLKLNHLKALCSATGSNKFSDDDKSELRALLEFRSSTDKEAKYQSFKHLPEARYEYMKWLGSLRKSGKTSRFQNQVYDDLVREFVSYD